MTKVISLIVIGLLAHYWWNTQKLKQLAMKAANLRCKDAGVQLLDHTVVQNRLGLVKDSRKRWRLQREYMFDFTSTGEHRYQGRVFMQGNHVVGSELDAFTIN